MEQFVEFFNTLKSSFIAGGDFNAKHTHKGSRPITTRGRHLQVTMNNNYKHLSTGDPHTAPQIGTKYRICSTSALQKVYHKSKKEQAHVLIYFPIIHRY